MNRKFKAISLALVAVFALSAVVASSAMATPPKFTASAYPAIGTGSQVVAHKFTADTYATTCEVATFTTASENEAKSTATVTPKYEKCKTAGVASTVTMNGCTYKFDLTTTGVPNFATVSLVCSGANEVTIELGNPATPNCIIHVAPFTNKHSVEVKNSGTGILATANVTGIHANLTDTIPATCPFNGNTTVTNATYTGTVQLNGSAGQTIDVG